MDALETHQFYQPEQEKSQNISGREVFSLIAGEKYIFNVGRKVYVSEREKSIYFTSGEKFMFNVGRKVCD